MSTRREPSFNQEFTPQDYINESSPQYSGRSEYSPDHVELYNGAVKKPNLGKFLDQFNDSSNLEGYDLEEPEVRISWYSFEEGGDQGRLETIFEREYVSEIVPEDLAASIPKIPVAKDVLYKETVEYEEVEDVKWEEAVEKLDEAGIKPSGKEV